MQVVSPVEKARQYIESHSNRIESSGRNKAIKFQPGPCITISRESGAGAVKVSEKVIHFFRESYNGSADNTWTVFDRNLIEKVLQDNHLPKTLSNLMSEEKYSGVKSMMGEILGGQPGIWSLVHKTTETILQLAQVGNCIILDRGANVITTKLNNSFHVRLVAPLEERIRHIRELFNLERKAAMDYIKKEEEDRRDYLMTYFHKDINDPLLYHLIINTGYISEEKAGKIIANAVINRFPDMFQIDS